MQSQHPHGRGAEMASSPGQQKGDSSSVGSQGFGLVPQAPAQTRSEGDRCVTDNNPTLGLASQGDGRLASPQ